MSVRIDSSFGVRDARFRRLVVGTTVGTGGRVDRPRVTGGSTMQPVVARRLARWVWSSSARLVGESCARCRLAAAWLCGEDGVLGCQGIAFGLQIACWEPISLISAETVYRRSVDGPMTRGCRIAGQADAVKYDPS